jgi:hypothetical protein
LFECCVSSDIGPICQETCTSGWEALELQHGKKYSKIRDGLRKKEQKKAQKRKNITVGKNTVPTMSRN